MGFVSQSDHPSWLNYHHLYYFRIIAKEGSIARASTRLRLGQSTLSAQLKLLEDSLGHQLFERKNRQLVLTDAGKTALAYANEVFRLGDEMVGTLRDQCTLQVVSLQIGLIGGVPETLLRSLVSHAKRIQDCRLTFYAGKKEDLIRDLLKHQLDLVLTNDLTALSGERNLQFRSLQVNELEVWAAPQFQGLVENFPHSLQNQSFVLPPVSCKAREDVEQFFRLNSLQVDVFAETQSVRLQRLIAQEGLGLMIASRANQSELLQDGKLISLGKMDQLQEEVWIVSALRKTEDPVIKRMMDALCYSSTATSSF